MHIIIRRGVCVCVGGGGAGGSFVVRTDMFFYCTGICSSGLFGTANFRISLKFPTKKCLLSRN